MKKLLSFILTVLCVFSFASCSTETNSNQNDNPRHTVCSFGNWITTIEPTCDEKGEEKRFCSICNKNETKTIKELGHNNINWKCTRCNGNLGDWEIRHYVDEFNNPTNEKYITNKELIVGTFSNSATNNSLLYVKFLIDNLDGLRISIILYEYGRNQVKASYEKNFTITLLDTNKTKHDLKGIMYSGGDRVKLYVSYGGYDYISTMFNALCEEGTVSLYMVESKYVKSEYLFSFDTSNFFSLYSSL